VAGAAVLAGAAHPEVGDSMTSFLSDSDIRKLTQQIEEIEAASHAEIVTVVAQRSDSYRYIPLLWAALVSLAVPGFYYLIVEIGYNNWTTDAAYLRDMPLIYAAQVVVFLLLSSLFQIQAVQMLLIPKSVKHRRAHRQALQQFMQHRVHWTQDRSGILLFVSVAEHYVEIVPDKAVAEKIDSAQWQQAVDRFVAQIKQGKVAEGFSQALNDCSALVTEHLPRTQQSKNELGNHLILLPAPD